MHAKRRKKRKEESGGERARARAERRQCHRTYIMHPLSSITQRYRYRVHFAPHGVHTER